MSRISPIIILGAWVFNFLNAVSIGGHLAGYSSPHRTHLALGLPLWALGFAGTVAHDEILRRLRRPSSPTRSSSKDDKAAAQIHTVPDGHGGTKTYVLPQQGLFGWVLSAHYLCEWIEWVGFYVATGGSVPARNFVAAEVATMLPRAVTARRWYQEHFGDAVKGRWAVLPGIV